MASNYEKSEYFKSLMLSMLTGHTSLSMDRFDELIEKGVEATNRILDAAQAVYELEDDEEVNADDPFDDGGFNDEDEDVEDNGDYFGEETPEATRLRAEQNERVRIWNESRGNADFWRNAPEGEVRLDGQGLVNRLREWEEQNPQSEDVRAVDNLHMRMAEELRRAYMRQRPQTAEEVFLQNPAPPEGASYTDPYQWTVDQPLRDRPFIVAVDPATEDPPLQLGRGLMTTIEENTHNIPLDLNADPVDMLREMTQRIFGDNNPITPEQEAQMDQLESDWTNQIPPSSHPPPRHRPRPDEGQPQCGW